MMIRSGYDNGFTLIELLIAMAMAGIIMAIMVTAYQVQVKGKNTQEMTIDMHNTARAAFEVLETDIHLAGCDPTGGADAQILVANPAELHFTMDVGGGSFGGDADGDLDDLGEEVRYALTNDGDKDGIADGTPCDLGRVDFNNPDNPGNDLRSFAEDIDALNFVYLGPDDDGDGQPDVLTAPIDLEDIRSIQVTIVARSGEAMPGLVGSHTDSTSYYNQQGDEILPPQNDNFRRLRLTKTIHCRNIR